jgi:phenylacetate-CoA ligase
VTFLEPDPVERLSPEEVAETVDRPRLARQLAYVARASAFYREKYAAAGIPQRDAADPANFARLPLTDKPEVLAEQDAHPPYGRLATGDDPRGLRRVHSTSGSTGRPYFIVMTEADIAATVEAGRRALRCAGLAPEDTVIHCLNYCLWAGGLTDHLNLEATGATVIPFGVGNTKLLIETIRALRPTAISCTPSYVSRLEVVLREEFGLVPRDLALRKAFLGGEGGLQQPAVRRQIEETWGMQAIDANYGMADVLSIFGAECDVRQGLHFHGQGVLALELINPETCESLPVAGGQVGEMVLTNLRRDAQPLVRFRTRDLVRIVSTEPCACGRRSLRFLVAGRSDQMFAVRGVNVFPAAIENLLGERHDWFSGEFEFVLDHPPPIERPLLRVELAKAFRGDRGPAEKFVLDRCHQRLQFTPRLELLAFGAFPRTESKTRRVRRTYE